MREVGWVVRYNRLCFLGAAAFLLLWCVLMAADGAWWFLLVGVLLLVGLAVTGDKRPVEAPHLVGDSQRPAVRGAGGYECHVDGRTFECQPPGLCPSDVGPYQWAPLRMSTIAWCTGNLPPTPSVEEAPTQSCRSALPALGTVHRVSFDADLIALRQSPDAAPTQRMKVRHERRVGAGNSLAQLLVGDRSSDYQLVALYSLRATKGTKPVVVVEVSSSTDLDCLEQGAEVTVRGWPTVGRAVALDLGQSVVEAVYPCVSPVFRPMRFK